MDFSRFKLRYYWVIAAIAILAFGAYLVCSCYNPDYAALISVLIGITTFIVGFVYRGNEYVIDVVEKEVPVEKVVEKIIYVNKDDIVEVLDESKVKKAVKKKGKQILKDNFTD